MTILTGSQIVQIVLILAMTAVWITWIIANRPEGEAEVDYDESDR